MTLTPIILSDATTYIGAFLTFSCQLRCAYCINHHGGDLVNTRKMSKEDWIRGLNRIHVRSDLPITLQGGEPTVYKDFFEVVNGIEKRIHLNLLTNLEIDIEKFCSAVSPDRMRRNSNYASIRVSYHHGQSDFENLMRKVSVLQKRGYSVGVWEVGHPGYIHDVYCRKERATAMGIDYRIKEFLGPWNGKTYGVMRYEHAVNSDKLRHCECKTSELLIAPDGNIFRCHSDLYAGRQHIGNIMDEKPLQLGEWIPCLVFGKCNSCDIRAKTTVRFTKSGHSGVEIRNIGEPYADAVQIINVVNTYGKR